MFILLGNSRLTYKLAQAILNQGYEIKCIVVSEKNTRPNNSINLKVFSKSKKINYLEIKSINQINTIKRLKKYSCDYIISTWHEILSRDVLKIPKFFCIGSHPTDILNIRGRHPLHWLVSMRVKKSKFTFFKMNEKIDDGQIIKSMSFKIEKNINKSNLNMETVAVKCLNKMISKNKILISSRKNKKKLEKPNYYRKRNIHDITIDSRMNFSSISSIIDSFTYPNYPGPRLYYAKNKYLIIKNYKEIKLEYKTFNKFENGTILKKRKYSILLKINNGAIDINFVNKISKLPKKIKPPSFYFDKV